MITLKVLEKWNGLMVNHMRVNSYKINDMVKGLTNGMMAESIQDDTLMVLKKVLEKWSTLMVIHMKVNF